MTSTLQEEASRKMVLGQSELRSRHKDFYEAGLITYMRTDSTNLSETALTEIAIQNIEQTSGAKYVETRRYKNEERFCTRSARSHQTLLI
nr:DNA topoisomerase [Candidatus Brachybacter algidus]